MGNEKGKMQNAKSRSECVLLRTLLFCLFPLVFFIQACRQDMHDQPKYQPLEASDFFADGRASRPVPTGTVARGQLNADTHLYSGKIGNKFADTLPFAVSPAVLERGQERFNIFALLATAVSATEREWWSTEDFVIPLRSISTG